jgi:hypothetical protein
MPYFKTGAYLGSQDIFKATWHEESRHIYLTLQEIKDLTFEGLRSFVTDEVFDNSNIPTIVLMARVTSEGKVVRIINELSLRDVLEHIRIGTDLSIQLFQQTIYDELYIPTVTDMSGSSHQEPAAFRRVIPHPAITCRQHPPAGLYLRHRLPLEVHHDAVSALITQVHKNYFGFPYFEFPDFPQFLTIIKVSNDGQLSLNPYRERFNQPPILEVLSIEDEIITPVCATFCLYSDPTQAQSPTDSSRLMASSSAG